MFHADFRSSWSASMSTRHLNQRELAERWTSAGRWNGGGGWARGPGFSSSAGRVVYRLEDVERYEAEQLRDSTTGSSASATPEAA